jgi:hypothetical protein
LLDRAGSHHSPVVMVTIRDTALEPRRLPEGIGFGASAKALTSLLLLCGRAGSDVSLTACKAPDALPYRYNRRACYRFECDLSRTNSAEELNSQFRLSPRLHVDIADTATLKSFGET